MTIKLYFFLVVWNFPNTSVNWHCPTSHQLGRLPKNTVSLKTWLSLTWQHPLPVDVEESTRHPKCLRGRTSPRPLEERHKQRSSILPGPWMTQKPAQDGCRFFFSFKYFFLFSLHCRTFTSPTPNGLLEGKGPQWPELPARQRKTLAEVGPFCNTSCNEKEPKHPKRLVLFWFGN